MHAFVPPSPFLRRRPPRRRPGPVASASPDVVVIGAGIAGLSTAYQLAQHGASVHIITSPDRKPAAYASAGMLAPHAEHLSGHMNTLCRLSREMYPDFVRRLQRLVDVDVRYVSRNDFLIPSMTPLSGPDVLTNEALRSVEPSLGPHVKAARRSPGDASVDSRALIDALYKACNHLGVTIQQDAVRSIVVAPSGRSVDAVQSETCLVRGGHYLVASGAWTANLMPELPIRPVKGQMLSLVPPERKSIRLNHVLYGHDVYIVPKKGGSEYYVGATVENAGFDTKTTAGGISHLLNAATELVPGLAEYEISEMWSGLRPATPDLMPLLGSSEYDNVSIASGYYRNGILLAPAASKIAAAFALGEENSLPTSLRDLAQEFSYRRFRDVGRDSAASSVVPTRRVSDGMGDGLENHPSKSVTASSIGNTDIKLWKVHPDGTKEAVVPGRRFQETLKQSPDKSRAVPESKSRPTAFTAENSTNTDIKLWKVKSDGTKEAVTPSRRFLETLKQSPGRSRAFTEFTAEKPTTGSVQTDAQVYQGGEGFEEALKTYENTSAQNDAYEDVLRKRANADEVMSKAMAANRAFGRTKSSLETEGTPQLSISEEEVAAFDDALKKGIEDMERLEKHFDPRDESVRATQAEKERLHSDAMGTDAKINGFLVSALEEGDSGTTNLESSGGYF